MDDYYRGVLCANYAIYFIKVKYVYMYTHI